MEANQADSYSLKNGTTLDQTIYDNKQLNSDAVQDMSSDDLKKSTREINTVECSGCPPLRALIVRRTWSHQRKNARMFVGKMLWKHQIHSQGAACDSFMRTEEVESGKFVRKCEKTEEILRNCIGKPAEVLQSNKEYTEEDITDEVLKGRSVPFSSSDGGVFDFPGLRNDIEVMERNLLGGLSRFFDTAE
ncbi:hypothetical protein JHK85_054998 [Glycine max]|nr:hypothetical protein JHK85_054998 [Glycine max]